MKNLFYLSTIDQYLGTYNLFTSHELSEIDSLEKDWLSTQKNYSFYELINIFPQIKTDRAFKKQLKDEIKQARQVLIKAQQLETNYQNKTAYDDPDQKETKRLIYDAFVLQPVREEKNKLIKENCIKLSILNYNPKQEQSLTSSKITALDVMKAKHYPIENIYSNKLKKIGTQSMGKCPFHNERHGSFVIYHKNNNWYCFGACSEGGDSINYIMKLNQISFIEAVKYLINI